jgi:hypothetical protein
MLIEVVDLRILLFDVAYGGTPWVRGADGRDHVTPSRGLNPFDMEDMARQRPARWR